MAGTSTTRLTVLISGNGTNLAAIIQACASSALPSCHIVRVISNRKRAYGLERAQEASISTTYHNLVPYKQRHQDADAAREDYDKDLANIVLADQPDIVICAGWMHILSPAFLDPVAKAGVLVINLHPALPGQFNGANAIERAHAAWKEGRIEKTGVMIHRVISEVDMGEPILVVDIPFIEDRDEEIDVLRQRIHEIEWKAIVEGTAAAIRIHKSASQTEPHYDIPGSSDNAPATTSIKASG